MTDLSALIVELEKATESSRELDGRIYAYLNGLNLGEGMNAFVSANGGFFQYALEKPVDGYWAEILPQARVPQYSSSIDAALTLGRSSAEKFRMLEAVFRADYPADEARHLFIACRAIVLEALKARQASPRPSEHRTR